MDNKLNIDLKLDSSIQDSLSSTSIKLTKDCNSSFCAYNFDLPSASVNLATANIISGKKNLHLEKVSGLQIFTTTSGAITSFVIYTAGVPSNARHEDAMAYFYQQVQNLNAAGWQRYIFPDEARVPGAEASKFSDLNEVLGNPVATGPWKDPNLKLTKQNWISMRIFNTWMFFNGNEYLSLGVQREKSEADPQNRGSYLFTWTFKSESDFYADFVGAEDRNRWKELLPAQLTRMAKERQKTEAQLKKMGIKIDENYKDAKPPVEAG